MADFRKKVINFICGVPRGNVVSYGQVATACGKPRGAREVGWILRRIDPDDVKIPWWRVVNNQGVISIKGNWTANKGLQASLLKKEGIKISKDFTLDMKKYRYLGSVL